MANIELNTEFEKVKAISEYQFGSKITEYLFNNLKDIKYQKSKTTNKIRYIYNSDELLLTLKPDTGLFSLSFLSAKIIIENFESPTLRCVVKNEVSEFIKSGRNVFCKHVVDIDNKLRVLDEVIVVSENQEILAIGRLKVPVPNIKQFKNGIAILVRKGINKYVKIKNLP